MTTRTTLHIAHERRWSQVTYAAALEHAETYELPRDRTRNGCGYLWTEADIDEFEEAFFVGRRQRRRAS